MGWKGRQGKARFKYGNRRYSGRAVQLRWDGMDARSVFLVRSEAISFKILLLIGENWEGAIVPGQMLMMDGPSLCWHN